MPESKSGSNLREINRWQRDAARAEYLRHPDASIAEVAKATNVALRTVARARATLVKEGLLPAGRNATASAADAIVLAQVAKEGASRVPGDDVSDVPGEPREAASIPTSARGSTVDGEALRKMNEM
ncbi:MAG: hypothetical protein ACREJC_17135, partial [Tepidisphaeraceae bacterium]